MIAISSGPAPRPNNASPDSMYARLDAVSVRWPSPASAASLTERTLDDRLRHAVMGCKTRYRQAWPLSYAAQGLRIAVRRGAATERTRLCLRIRWARRGQSPQARGAAPP